MKKLVKLVAVISILSTTIGASAIGAEMKKGMHNNMAMSHENMEKMHNNVSDHSGVRSPHSCQI